ncbi:RYamide receptor-like [Hyposmocoma kahamanoa]|uniref:RYamide receptor-like n=1 Tax=Hyposmocoma kahamanoa TaxID=1477025 RepID=UPI000E6D9F89|nr:RYamide receptor-like [Hyposmocoma kahamanoa]
MFDVDEWNSVRDQAFESLNVTLASQPTEDDIYSTLARNSSWQYYDTSVCTSGSSEDTLSVLFHVCVYFLYCAVFVVSLVGNGLVCFVVHKTPRMKTVTNYFIVNLAVGDILMTLFCVPFSFVSMLVLRHWPFGGVMCKVVNYSQAVSVMVSAFTMFAISIDRYMAIMRPLKPRLSRTAAKLVVAVVWTCALATAAPIAFVSRTQKPSEWHKFCELEVCLEHWEHRKQSEQYSMALLALQFGLPLCALVCTYARIAHAVWGGRPPGEAQSARDTRIRRSKRKMIKMMVAVVIVFTVCWLPLNFLWSLHEDDESWGAWPGMPYVWFASHWLAMSHSCYNPIIYCYMNARYRRGFKMALCCLLRIHAGTRSPLFRRSTSMGEGVPMSATTQAMIHSLRMRTAACASDRSPPTFSSRVRNPAFSPKPRAGAVNGDGFQPPLPPGWFAGRGVLGVIPEPDTIRQPITLFESSRLSCAPLRALAVAVAPPLAPVSDCGRSAAAVDRGK